MRKSALALAAGAVVFGAASATVHFVVVPGQEQVQSSTDTTVHYAGTVSFLNQQALATGDTANAFSQNVPFTADERVKTVSINGGTAVLSDVTTAGGAGAQVIGNTSAEWAVHPKTLMPATVPAGSKAIAHKGLAVGFAFNPKARDYPWWDGTTQAQATAKYVRAEKFQGLSSYVYTVDATGPVKDPKLTGSLPAQIPAATLKALASTRPAAEQQMLGAMLPKGRGAMVPLSYAAETKTTMWVDKLTGRIVDAKATETVTAQMQAGATAVPLTSVLTVNTETTPASVADMVKQSKDDATRLMWLGTVAPIALGVIAVLLLAGAGWRLRGKSSPAVAEAAPAVPAETA